ncbi:MAG TPA: hypothetical protein VMT38_04955 [Terracidiphilus sp.]|nr:hypothetical protein [Terracidiphilus sp.]
MPGIIESQPSSRSPDSRSTEIRATLERLLGTQHFSAASRRGQLLRFLVEHTLAGDADKINEYAIGLEVFQRPASFDPRIESVVRTEFSRLRQRLRDYYAEDGRRDSVVIEFPPRSYVASFTFRDPAKLREPAVFPEPIRAPQALRSGTHRSKMVWITVAVAVLLIAAAAVAGVMLWRQHVSNLAGRQPIHAIVVLPFADYSPHHQDEYIADGITEELTNDLAQWRDLRVVARTSAFAFKDKGEDVREIGRELNVDAVLEGSFTRDGKEMRVTAQLNRASDGYHLWSHSYETESDDMLAMQDTVANSITDAIGRIRGGSAPAIHEPTTNPEALDLYLQGEYQLHLGTAVSLSKAEDLFKAAIAKDPRFALAYLGIGYAEINATSLTTETSDESMPRVRQAAQKAIELDPSLGDAYGMLAVATYVGDWDWTNGEAEFKRAIALGSKAPVLGQYGWALTTRGRFADAHEQFRQAAELDPLSAGVPFNEFFAYNFERDVAGEVRVLNRLREIRPDYFGGPALTLVMAMGRHDCATVRAKVGPFASAFPKLPVTQTMLAFDAVCRTDKAEALRRIKDMESQKAPHYQIAIVYALLHDKDNAIAELTRCADAREGQILYIKYDPFFDEIRNDPRYVALEKRVGLE